MCIKRRRQLQISLISTFLSLLIGHPAQAADQSSSLDYIKLDRAERQAFSSSTGLTLAQADTSGGSASAAGDEVEEVYVVGIRKSLEDSITAKRNAEQILDAISAEDIGELPDLNVAEAIQRITGVQINRNDAGDGSNFQVRGLSQNRVEINGRSLVSDDANERTNAFDSISSALFKGIEVIKSPTADTTEGALGATIRLKTFKPLEFKKDFTLSASGQFIKHSNDDEGGLVNGLVSKRWSTSTLGEVGMLVNFSYDERDATTEAWQTNWQAPAKRNNYFCSPGVGGPNGTTNCTIGDSNTVATGTIIRANGTVDQNVVYPYAQVRDPAEERERDPILDYMVYHPSAIVYERKPFQNEKIGLDVSFQIAPTDSMEFYLQLNRNDFDQIRPQTKIVIPSGGGGNGTRMQDDFIIQEFTRPATGNEYRFVPGAGTAVENGVTGGYQLATGDITRGVMLRQIYDEEGARFANNNQNKEQVQEVIALGFDYQATGWNISADINVSSTESDTDAINLNMNFLTPPVRSTVFDFTNTSFDLPVTGMFDPASPYNFSTGTCDLAAGATAPCGIDYFDINDFQFGGFNGPIINQDIDETEIKVDVDWDFDKFGITTLEFGTRFTEGSFERTSANVKRLNQPSGNMNIIHNIDPVFAGLRQFAAMEALEPGFISNGLAPTPVFLEDHTASPVQPRQWLTPIFGAQYDMWFNRLAGGAAFYRKNRGGDFIIDETSSALYAKMNFESELFGFPFTGNAGIRAVQYEYEGDGFKQADPTLGEGDPTIEQEVVALDGVTHTITDTNYVPIASEREISKVLPSFNINFAISDDMLVRAAIAKVISMPNPKDFAPVAPDINATTGAIITGSIGNPDLDPYEADQLDLSYEWYLSSVSSFTAGLFFKDIKNFIVNQAKLDTVANPDCDTTGTPPLGFACSNPENSDADPNNDIGPRRLRRLKQPINAGGATVQGLELAYRTVFDMLPGWASGFGLEANYTFTDSDQDEGINEITGEDLQVKNLSESAYNFTLFYENYGFSFRAAYNFREESFRDLGTVQPDRGELFELTEQEGIEVFDLYSNVLPSFNKERGQLDISMKYRLFDRYTIFLQANNVTKEVSERYIGVEQMRSRYLDVGASYRIGIKGKL